MAIICPLDLLQILRVGPENIGVSSHSSPRTDDAVVCHMECVAVHDAIGLTATLHTDGAYNQKSNGMQTDGTLSQQRLSLSSVRVGPISVKQLMTTGVLARETVLFPKIASQ